jgi:CubicO group peptidase (beta-lactamase class C family)
MQPRKLLALGAALGLTLQAPTAALAQAAASTQTPAPVAAPAGTPALTAADATTWLDGFMPYAIRRGNIAGAVVVVVKDGQVLTEKGYGVSDVATGAPVSPTQTLFRPGSISKLFTWTAVMQLVEQHKIDLDADINTYLDFKIPPAYGKPITMRELMQHTEGFGEVAKHLLVTDPARARTIEQYLKAWTPPRIFAPGEVPAYSNYGATLAGYIVQRVSGEPFDDYVAQHIFQPLGMNHSTMDQPLPANLAPLMSKGYLAASKPPVPFEIVSATPAGGLTASGDDMGKFMLAHLGQGRLGSAEILQPETAALMHRQSFQLAPPLPGFALGFYHEDRNGHEIIGHAGDTNLFHSDLHLFINDGVGLFVSFNSPGNAGAAGVIRTELLSQFADRYFPAPPSAPLPTLASAKQDGAKMLGSWRLSRRAEGNFLDLAYLLSEAKITMAPDGVLTVSSLKNTAGTPIKWREVGPFVWQEVGGESKMAAVVKNGAVTAIAFDNEPPVFVLQRTPLSRQAGLLFPILGAAAGLLAILGLSWPISAFTRWRYGKSFRHTGQRATAYRLVRGLALVEVVFVVGIVFALINLLSSALVIDGDQDSTFRVFQMLGVIGLLGLIVGPWNLVLTWGDKTASWWAKLTSLLTAVAFYAVTVIAVMIHLLTFSMNY